MEIRLETKKAGYSVSEESPKLKEEKMRKVLVIIFMLLIFSGCGVKSVFHRRPAEVESEVIKKADWEVDFRDVYFLDANNGWVIGDKV